MANRRHLAALLIALTAAVPALCQSQPAPAGEIRALVPVGNIQRGSAAPIAAQRSAPVYWQDVVRTEAGGRVRIGLLDGSVLNVGSQSTLLIAKHDPAAQQTDLELTYGRIRANAVRVTQPAGRFQVRTPVAVTGTVGTRFYIFTTADQSLIFCLENALRVRNALQSVGGEVTVHAGQFTRVRKGLPPETPAAFSPEQLQQAEDETSIPLPLPVLSRVEISRPPENCGEELMLGVRAWTKPAAAAAETPVDPELLSGKLLLGNNAVAVEGGRALVTPSTVGAAEASFVAPGGQPIKAKIWQPLKVAEGQGWRAPRAALGSDAFYVLGPSQIPGAVVLTFNQQPATLLWSGTCGAGFLPPPLSGGTYTIVLKAGEKPLARGQINLVTTSYDAPQPPILRKGQGTQVTIQIGGLRQLDQSVQGRPILVTTVTNNTPTVLGDLRSKTPGATSSGNSVIFKVSAANLDPSGTARLQISGRGRQAGEFVLNVRNQLDEALELPSNPLVPAQP
jgi:hypothetical protein